MPDTLLLLAAVGYGLAALAYLGLSGLIVASWRQRPQGRLLVLATGLSAVWGALSALTAWGVLPPRLGLAAEVARNGAWLALLLYILRLRLPSGATLPAPLRLIRALGRRAGHRPAARQRHALHRPHPACTGAMGRQSGAGAAHRHRTGAGRAGLSQHPPGRPLGDQVSLPRAGRPVRVRLLSLRQCRAVQRDGCPGLGGARLRGGAGDAADRGFRRTQPGMGGAGRAVAQHGFPHHQPAGRRRSICC